MSTATTSRVARSRPSGLLWLGGVAAFGIGTSAVYAATGLGFPCPFRSATGWDCPFCGGTRMGEALLHGDPVTAFGYNPAALVGLVLATLVGGWLLVELAFGRQGQLAAATRRLAGRLPVRWSPGVMAVLVLIALAVWTVARNLILCPLP